MSGCCSVCGLSIPEGQSLCSMCAGNSYHGSDEYYMDWLTEGERKKEEEQALEEEMYREQMEREENKGRVKMTEIELIHGDCLDVMRKMLSLSVDAVISDPPYDFPNETKRICDISFWRLNKGSRIIFCPPENQWDTTCDQWLFWVKPISTKNTSKSYSRFVEMIQVWNGETWNADRHWSQYTNVFTDLVEDREHPYTKPLSLMTRLVLNHTNEGDTVLDPFMGSGTTGLACLLTNRNFIGIEINSNYFTVAEKRIENFKINPTIVKKEEVKK